MNSLQIQVRQWTQLSVGIDWGQWDTTSVFFCVEFMLDGRAVTELSGSGSPSSDVTVFDVEDLHLATEVLMGRARLDDHFPLARRVPLLLCPCGDATEGALTVRLKVAKDTVTWDDWAWERDDFPPEWLTDLPAYHFQLDEYESALAQARLTAIKYLGTASSRIRATSLGSGIRTWLNRKFQGELSCHLRSLKVQVLEPAQESIDEELQRVLSELSSIRSALKASEGNRRYEPTRAQKQLVVASASRIIRSTEAFRLPWQTLESVKWLRYKMR